jgi:Methylamine utilisation protein MauE
VICALLAIAGAHKILVPQGARGSLALIGVSAPSLAVRALGAAEVALGTVAVVSPNVVTGTLLAVTYGAFCGFVLLLLVRDPAGSVDCGCFGGAEHRPGWLHVALNGVACTVAAAGAVIGSHGIGWILDRSGLIAPSLIIGLVATTYAAYLTYTALPVAWASYGSGAGR